MNYTLTWMRGPKAMGSEAFSDLRAATRHADDMIAQMRSRFGATAVKVVDEEGTPHFLNSVSRS